MSSEGMKEFVMFNVSGAIGTALFYALYTALVWAYPVEWPYPATAAWVGSYTPSIAWQHVLHQLFVFGTPEGGSVLSGLGKTYVVYSASLVGSTAINWLAVEKLSVAANAAFVLGLVITGAINFVASKYWAFADDGSGGDDKDD
ncbi:uncharacterized protein AMSG_01805 [Thecamonas trahens ATCC 50062]|uniref:GtrA/DPMS transmembrane domain-containing protein n=1 Tax=Thecamonas trahens ATCC 50062 TaxID=461836 RepID=A0A0L0DVH8_THETB|nr:hypothetical protein AMSG_01805 [Thecamonas trahens ATCC 50062]KNC55543.1 hypothetical protein AMSG_01805 [Thecamonas trahens ATCC 50062]|eukprot:XP_013761317.1 hypothetical protein AMSG_01805 [Thecamonas trahens ATCC 50062]